MNRAYIFQCNQLVNCSAGFNGAANPNLLDGCSVSQVDERWVTLPFSAGHGFLDQSVEHFVL